MSRRRDNLSWGHHEVAASLEPEVADRLLAQAEEDGLSVQELRRLMHRMKASFRASELPNGVYRVLYADPPWQYSVEGYGSAEQHYPTLSIDELCALPISQIVAPDAVLFLWVTAPFLQNQFQVIEAWGFEYKTNFVWDKVKHNMGHYNSVRHEFLLVATKGSCTPDTPKLHDSVVSIERSDKHSEKPERFREIIDGFTPQGEGPQ